MSNNPSDYSTRKGVHPISWEDFHSLCKGLASVVLYAHSWGVAVPDYIGLVTDALILYPWDREIYKNGEFQFHPEYADALGLQGLKADSTYLIGAEPAKIEKA